MAHPRTDGTSALTTDERYTIADYLSWPEEERWELIHGVAYSMSPAPRLEHQNTVGELFWQLKSFLRGKRCQPVVAPVDVFLSEDGKDRGDQDTVVQPDVFVVCDPAKLTDRGIWGPPDFIAEVLSESTALKDLQTKKSLYEIHGVKEYWIVKPDHSVFVYRGTEGRFGTIVEFLADQDVPSSVLPGFVWNKQIVAES